MPNTPILNKLNASGVVLKTNCKIWRAKKQLTPEDLGLDPETVNDSIISLGNKLLVRPEAVAPFRQFESRVQGYVEQLSFKFMNNVGRFIPNTQLTGCIERLKEFNEEFKELQAEFLSKYEEHYADSIAMWAEQAQELQVNPDELTGRIREALPEQDSVASRFGFKWNLFYIAAPKRLEIHVDEISEDQIDMLSDIRIQAANQAAEILEESAKTFVAQVVTENRDRVATIIEEVHEKIREKDDKIHENTLTKLLNMIERFAVLDFIGDAEMSELMASFEQSFLQHQAKEYRDDDFLRSKLKGGAKKLARVARELALADTSKIAEQFADNATQGETSDPDEQT